MSGNLTHLQRELFEKGVRDSLWLSLLCCQQVPTWQDVTNRVTTLLAEVDERRQEAEEDAIAADDAADEMACVKEWVGCLPSKPN